MRHAFDHPFGGFNDFPFFISLEISLFENIESIIGKADVVFDTKGVFVLGRMLFVFAVKNKGFGGLGMTMLDKNFFDKIPDFIGRD